MEGGGLIQFCHSGFFLKEIAYLVLIAGNGGSKNTSLLQWGRWMVLGWGVVGWFATASTFPTPPAEGWTALFSFCETRA